MERSVHAPCIPKIQACTPCAITPCTHLGNTQLCADAGKHVAQLRAPLDAPRRLMMHTMIHPKVHTQCTLKNLPDTTYTRHVHTLHTPPERTLDTPSIFTNIICMHTLILRPCMDLEDTRCEPSRPTFTHTVFDTPCEAHETYKNPTYAHTLITLHIRSLEVDRDTFTHTHMAASRTKPDAAVI